MYLQLYRDGILNLRLQRDIIEFLNSRNVADGSAEDKRITPREKYGIVEEQNENERQWFGSDVYLLKRQNAEVVHNCPRVSVSCNGPIDLL